MIDFEFYCSRLVLIGSVIRPGQSRHQTDGHRADLQEHLQHGHQGHHREVLHGLQDMRLRGDPTAAGVTCDGT